MIETIIVGILVAVIAGLILYHVFGVGKSPGPPAMMSKSLPEKPPKSSEASGPMKIVQRVNKQTPYMKSKVEKSYEGLKVEWKLNFSSIHELDHERVHVTFSDNGHYPWVYTDLSLKKYPELKSMPEGAKVTVVGILKKVNGHAFYLKDVSLGFDA